MVLAIETSCDETAVAILRGPREILASEIASQIELHRRYGGVVPEVASRNHLPKIRPLIEVALEHLDCSLADVDCVAATRGPGLLTSLSRWLQRSKRACDRPGQTFYRRESPGRPPIVSFPHRIRWTEHIRRPDSEWRTYDADSF